MKRNLGVDNIQYNTIQYNTIQYKKIMFYFECQALQNHACLFESLHWILMLAVILLHQDAVYQTILSPSPEENPHLWGYSASSCLETNHRVPCQAFFIFTICNLHYHLGSCVLDTHFCPSPVQPSCSCQFHIAWIVRLHQTFSITVFLNALTFDTSI